MRGDPARAAQASDEEVARTVAEWEQAQGLTVRDWIAIGREEEGRDEEIPPKGHLVRPASAG